jgi:hypothetical protein
MHRETESRQGLPDRARECRPASAPP